MVYSLFHRQKDEDTIPVLTEIIDTPAAATPATAPAAVADDAAAAAEIVAIAEAATPEIAPDTDAPDIDPDDLPLMTETIDELPPADDHLLAPLVFGARPAVQRVIFDADMPAPPAPADTDPHTGPDDFTPVAAAMAPVAPAETFAPDPAFADTLAAQLRDDILARLRPGIADALDQRLADCVRELLDAEVPRLRLRIEAAVADTVNDVVARAVADELARLRTPPDA